MPAAVYAALARHCTSLWHHEVAVSPISFTSLPREPARARVGAIQALKALQQLSRLGFMVQDDNELVALIDVVRTLLSSGLNQLEVLMLVSGISVSFGAIIQLAKLQGLPPICLCSCLALLQHASFVPHWQPNIFLSAVSGIGAVHVAVPGQSDGDLLRAMLASLEELGLPLPARLEITNQLA